MHHAILETALGDMGLGWTERGLARVALPGSNLHNLLSRWGHRGEPPPALYPLIERILGYARGEQVEFDDIELDFGVVPEFHRRCYDDIRALKWGQTTTYGAIAHRLGDRSLSRAVGQAARHPARASPVVSPDRHTHPCAAVRQSRDCWTAVSSYGSARARSARS